MELPSSELAPQFRRPHVVLLGAGASRAAVGEEAPLLCDLVQRVGLQDLLQRAGVEAMSQNFEEVYSRLVLDGASASVVRELEACVFEYFSKMSLPEHPTLYDHLVLSLRDKDVIATFNWDSLLWQALCRNARYASMPLAVYLHGNTGVGYCPEHKPMSVGTRSKRCQWCGRPYANSRLLYPVTKKDYTSDPFISTAWAQVKASLKNAYVFTVFGYSAPVSDVEAVAMLRGAWGSADERKLEEIELVNIAPEDETKKSWRPFIHSHHYGYFNDFYKTMLANAPRRSCEAYWAQNMDCTHLTPNVLPREAGWAELRAWFAPIVAGEYA
jgi:hypothetical protein